MMCQTERLETDATRYENETQNKQNGATL